MNQVPASAFLTVKRAVELLVQKKYREVEQLSHGVRLTADEIRRAIHDYGAALVAHPAADFQNCLDVVEITASLPRSWSITCDLWTKEEGRSDLSLEMTLRESGNDLMTIELDNIHVL